MQASPRSIIHIRLLQPEQDAPRLQGLNERVHDPYLPEHAHLVEQMHERARHAHERGSSAWRPLPDHDRVVADAAHEAFWVALAADSVEHAVGTLGLRRVGDAATAVVDTAESSGMPDVPRWVQSGSVGELRRMRVAPEWRRRGVASALLATALDYSASHGLEKLVLNTTAAQIPALALYQKHGFVQLTRTYLGVYELVWLSATYTRRRAPPQAESATPWVISPIADPTESARGSANGQG